MEAAVGCALSWRKRRNELIKAKGVWTATGTRGQSLSLLRRPRFTVDCKAESSGRRLKSKVLEHSQGR